MPKAQQSQTDPDDEAMIRLAAGEDHALDELMERWSARITAFLFRSTGNHFTATDLAQETFVRLYQARERYRAGGTFKALIFQIASNLARNHARWRKRHPETSIDREEFPEPTGAEHSTPAREAEADETAQAVKEAVLALPEDLREPLILSVYEGQEYKQIAVVLGCSPKAVEMRVYRARQILRDRLAEFLPQ
jgi:RNA polymerase sigma-70 factor (ECF subfamily)